MNRTRRTWITGCVVAVAGVCATAGAVTTQSFVLDDAATLEAGELDGTSVQSIGTVTLGVSTKRIELENVPIAQSLARARGGAVFIGTGTDGKVYRMLGDKVALYAETGQLLVSALTFGWGRTLYAATLPQGRIFAISGENKVRELVQLPETEHVWALVYDRDRDRLIAGTGPEGKVFSIDKKGNASVLHDSTASHIMSVALGDKGDLFAGTSDEALVLRIPRKGATQVVHDFSESEVTALAYRNGTLGVVVNAFAVAPGAVPPPAPALHGVGGPNTAPTAPQKRGRKGKGQLWRIDPAGRVERLLSRDDGHFTFVTWTADGALLVGAGEEGRIFRVLPDGQHATWVEVEERQVLAIDLGDNAPVFVTGDSAAAYRIEPGTPKNALWTSKVLDARFLSEWGRVTWRGSGKLGFDTRSGNTAEPDDSWSSWQEASGKAKSPAARFIQVRARFPRDNDAVLRAVELFYLPQNQRARVSDIQLDAAAMAMTNAEPSSSSRYPLTWTVDNPDGDALRFRLQFREEGQTIWRTLFSESRVLTKNQFVWQTNSIPDGHYIVRVEASDENANPTSRALVATADSEPLLIDNHPPRLRDLKMKRGRVQGRAIDDLGPITSIEYAIDGGTWTNVFPVDDLLDSSEERFSLELRELMAGSHIVAIRVTDAAKNQATAEITIKTKR